MNKRVPTKGTVSLHKGQILPLKVLREYMYYAETPLHWGMNRAAELASACHFALNTMDRNTYFKQQQIEWECEYAPELKVYWEVD